nr:uncharacterized protein C18orf63 homolog isoform X5 [Rattus norvegicus]
MSESSTKIFLKKMSNASFCGLSELEVSKPKPTVWYPTYTQQENMNEPKVQSLFFIILPDLHKLCTVQITLSGRVAEIDIRSTQIKMCRQLLLSHEDILTAPVPGILNQISVVMSIPFFKSGRLNAYIEKYEAKENKVKPSNLTTKKFFRESLTQATLVKPTRALNFIPQSTAAKHKVEPSVGQQRSGLFSAGCHQPGSFQDRKPYWPLKAPQLHLVESKLTRENTQAENKNLCSQGNRAPPFIPVFKRKSEQVNKNVSALSTLKRKQSGFTEPTTLAQETGATQGGKPSLGAATRKRPNSNIRVLAGNLSQKGSKPLQEKGTEFYDRKKEQPLSDLRQTVHLREARPSCTRAVTQTSRNSVAGVKNNVDIHPGGKDNLTSRFITQILGKSHESLKLKSQPHIFESDLETEDSQLQQQQLANQVQEADAAEHSPIESRAARSRRQTVCLESSRASTKRCSSAAHQRQYSSKTQVSNTAKPKNFLNIAASEYSEGHRLSTR